MLPLIILFALLSAILISIRLCSSSTSSRIYGSLLGALVLSVGVTLVLGLRDLVGFTHVTLWRLVDVTFRALCHTFPVVFLVAYAVMVYARKRGRDRARHAGFVPFAFSTVLVFIAMFLLIAGFTSTKIEPNWIEVTHTELTTPKWKKDAPPLRVVQLSDLHIDKFGYRESRTLKLVKRLKPDLILLTGDYTNFADRYPEVRRFMKELHAKYGVYAIHGNWNPSPGSERSFDGSDVHVIEYGTETVHTRSGKVVLGGAMWYSWKDGRTLFNGRISKDAYTILLSHMPESAQYAGPNVDLVLAGHTHGGQVRIPGIGPLITSSRIPRSQAAGLTKMPSGVLLYVNRGIGMEGDTAPRIRFLCRPEIAAFTIRGTGE